MPLVFKLLIFLGSMLISIGVQAQKYNVKTYSVNEGLPVSNIYDLEVSDDGYVWMASSVGLIRFDGKLYTLFDVNNGLVDALINDVFIDNNDTVWVSTDFGGIAKLDGEKFVYSNVLPEWEETPINGIFSPNENKFWIITSGLGVIIWDRNTNGLSYLTTENGLPSNTIWDIHFKSKSEIWIATANGIALYEPNLGITKVYTDENGLSGYAAFQIQHDDEQNLWVATSNGITILNKNRIVDTILEVDDETLDYVFTINKDENNTFWVGTERKGLVLIAEDGGTHQVTTNEGLCSNYIYRIVRDKDDRMWIASDGDGICLIKDQFFKLYDYKSDLSANSVFAIKQIADSTVYIATEDGITRFKNGEYKNIELPASFIKYDEVWDIEILPNGNLLLLTYNYDLFLFDGVEFKPPSFYDLISDLYLTDIFVDNEGIIWFSSYGVLVQLVGNDITTFNVPNNYYLQSNLGTIFKDSRGIMWITSEGGLGKFENGVFQFFDEDDGLISKAVYEITEDLNGNLWIGTNRGISFATADLLDNKEYKFTTFKKDELQNSETVFLQFDANGDLWQGTNAGLNYFATGSGNDFRNPLQLHFPLTDRGYGVEFNGPAKLLDFNGDLWFGTDEHGLVKVSQQAGLAGAFATDPPDIFLRSITANEQIVYHQPTNKAFEQEITLDFNHRDLVFRFNGIDYLHPDQISYRYKLDGYDTEWKVAVDINEVRYTNLPAGTYNLQIATKSLKSEWGEPQILANIQIKKPFYLTFVFFVVIFGLFIAIVVAYINARINRLEKLQLQKVVDKQTKELREALHEKEVLIKEIHHRVKNNLAVISGLLELQGFKMPAGDAKLAIQESRMRVVAMSKIHENLYQNDDLANVDFRKFIQNLVKGIQQTMDLAEKNIEVISYIDDLQLDVNVGVPLGLIINELISNAYKHAFEGKKEGSISISFKEKTKVYELIVADDGVGAESNILDSRFKSLGVSLIKSLSVQIGGYIEYETKNGAHFKLTIPKKALN